MPLSKSVHKQRVCVCVCVCVCVWARTYQNSLWWTWQKRWGERTSCSTLLSSSPPFLLPENSALAHKIHPVCVFVCVCGGHCYIFHVADDRRSYHSACIRVFDKAALVCEGQQACVCLVWLNAVRHIWKQLWWFDRLCASVCHAVCVLSFKCVITLFEALTLTDGCVCISWWMMSRRCLYVYPSVCVLCWFVSWSYPQRASCTCVLPPLAMETNRDLKTLGSRIWNMLMNQHNNNPSSHTQQKENEKLCIGFCLFPDLVSRQNLNYLILSKGNICWFCEIVLKSE